MPAAVDGDASSNGLVEIVGILTQIRDSLEANFELQDERITRIESSLATLVAEPRISRSGTNDLDQSPSSYRASSFPLKSVEQVDDPDISEEVVPYAGISPWTKISSQFKRTPKRLLWEDEKVLKRLQQEIWIPEDGRLALSFTIDRFCSCSSIAEAENILQDLHDFNQSLTLNGGYFLLRDSDLRGNSRYFTNYQRGQNQSEYALPPYPYMHWGFEKVVPVSAKEFRVPPRKWRTKGERLCGREPIAPWRRLCIIDNLARTYVYEQKTALTFRFAPGLNEMLSKHLTRSQFFRVDLGLESNNIRSGYKVQTGYNIQYSWYEVQHWHSTAKFESLEMPDEIPSGAGWHAGLLYGDPEKRRYAQVTFTIRARLGIQPRAPDHANDTMTPEQIGHFWTIVVLGNDFILPHYAVQPMDFCAPVFCLRLSIRIFKSVLQSARELASHLAHLLEAGAEAILDPSQHDALLFDDEAFSRSRKYFWAVDSLQDFKFTLSETLRVYEEFHEHQIEPMKVGRAQSAWPQGLEEAEREAKELKRKLEVVLAQFERQHSRAEALRSGLFDASNVIEARSSTRLNENIKLLTYVSIFYLPLAFSTSLWSTTQFFQDLSTGTLFWVMAVVAAITYFTVFNLDYLVHFSGKGYFEARNSILADMEDSTNEKWKARRDRYGQFKPQVQRSTLSEWYIAVYATTRVPARIWNWFGDALRKLYAKSPFRSEDSEDQSGPSTTTRTVSSIPEHGIPQDSSNNTVPLEAITSKRYDTTATNISGETMTTLPNHWRSP